jgi:hypothetical protein
MSSPFLNVKFLAVVEGRRGRVIGFIESERERYLMKYGASVIGEYDSTETAMKAAQLGAQGWRAPKSKAPEEPLISDADRDH